jgi:hypothetical protein
MYEINILAYEYKIVNMKEKKAVKCNADYEISDIMMAQTQIGTLSN